MTNHYLIGNKFAHIKEDIVHLQATEVIVLKLFIICMFKDPNLLENLTNFAENLKQKFNSAELMESVGQYNHTITYKIFFLCCLTTKRSQPQCTVKEKVNFLQARR